MNILLDPDAHPVIGHRGAAAYAPENTLESFALALTLGADALELDLRRSADGVPIVLHDPTLDRTTDRFGPAGVLRLEELQRADAGYRFSPEGGGFPFRTGGARIPTLREVLTAFPETPLLLELKEAAVQEAVASELVQAQAVERVVVAASDWRALAAFRKPPFQSGASQRDIARLYFGTGTPDPGCRLYAVPDRHHWLRIPTRRFVRKAHRLGAPVHVWTVDDTRLALRLWRRGVNGIVTNRPDLIRASRDSSLGPHRGLDPRPFAP